MSVEPSPHGTPVNNSIGPANSNDSLGDLSASARKRQKGKDITKCPDYLTLPKSVTEEAFGGDLTSIHEQDVDVVYVVNGETTSSAVGRIFKNSAHKGKSYEYRLRGGVKELCEKLLQHGWDKLNIVGFRRAASAHSARPGVVMQLKAYRQQDEDQEDSQSAKKRKRSNGMKPSTPGTERALLEAILKGDAEQTQTLLTCGVSPEVIFDQDGHTPLMLAADKGLAEICQLLINSGAQIDASNKYGDTSLLLAAHQGNLEVCRVLIQNGASLATGNRYGDTALLLAAIKKHDAVVKLLVDSGFDVNTSNEEGQTALHMACEKNQSEVVMLLLSCGASPNIMDKSGYTPLMFSAGVHGQEDLAKLLLSHGADINARHPMEGTVLVQAAAKGLHKVCHFLVSEGADVNAMNQSDQTALMFASRDGDLYTCQLYVARGADVNTADKVVGTSALMIAASRGRQDICRLLVSSGANLLLVDKDGKSGLCHAKAQGYLDLAQELTEHISFQAAQLAKDNKQQLLQYLAAALDHDNTDYAQIVITAAQHLVGPEGFSSLAPAANPALLQLVMAAQQPKLEQATSANGAVRSGPGHRASDQAAGTQDLAHAHVDVGVPSGSQASKLEELAALVRRQQQLLTDLLAADDTGATSASTTTLQRRATAAEEKLAQVTAAVASQQASLLALLGECQAAAGQLQTQDSTVVLQQHLARLKAELGRLTDAAS